MNIDKLKVKIPNSDFIVELENLECVTSEFTELLQTITAILDIAIKEYADTLKEPQKVKEPLKVKEPQKEAAIPYSQ